MEIKHISKIMLILSSSLVAIGTATAAQGLYTNGKWDEACGKCWPSPRTAKNNHCTPADCAIQGFYHCKPQDPPLAVDDDARLLGLIKSGDCTYVSNFSLNEGETDYVNSLKFCTHVLDKMAGRFNLPADPEDAAKLRMDFYLTNFKASVLGNAYSQLKLAMDYDVGMGTKQDRNKATLLYNQAARKGVPFAQYAIGARYAYGISMPKDKDKAIMWLNKALNNHPASKADKESQSLVAPCAMQLIGRLTPS